MTAKNVIDTITLLSLVLSKRVLHAVAHACDDGQVAIDQTVFNPSCITKLYGTLACNGDDTPHRPHRHSRITGLLSPLVVVRREQLEAVAGLNSCSTPTTYCSATSYKYKNNGSGEFDVREFLQKHHIGIKGEHRKDRGPVIELTACPFNADHGAHGEVAVFLGDNGSVEARLSGSKEKGAEAGAWSIGDMLLLAQ